MHGFNPFEGPAWGRPREPGQPVGTREGVARLGRMTGHLRTSEGLFGEVRLRLGPTDSSVSQRHGAFFYYTRSAAGRYREQIMSSRYLGGP